MLVEERAGQDSCGLRDVDRGGKISTGDGAGEDVGDRLEDTVHETLLSGDKCSILVGVAEQRCKDLPEGASGHAGSKVGECRDEVGFDVIGERGRAMRRNHGVNGVEQEARLIGPMTVDRGPRDTCLLSDTNRGDIASAMTGEKVDCRVEDDLAHPDRARILAVLCMCIHGSVSGSSRLATSDTECSLNNKLYSNNPHRPSLQRGVDHSTKRRPVTPPDAIASFDNTTISYTYDNGWSFTNTFDGHTRISVVPRRGELREHVQMTELRPGLYLASWIDEEMGLLAQILDLENRTVLAAIPVENNNTTEIIRGTITSPRTTTTKDSSS